MILLSHTLRDTHFRYFIETYKLDPEKKISDLGISKEFLGLVVAFDFAGNPNRQASVGGQRGITVIHVFSGLGGRGLSSIDGGHPAFLPLVDGHKEPPANAHTVAANEAVTE